MSGYSGYSMSNNAVAAYGEGKLPASKAAKEFGFKSTAGLRQCVAVCEWHHTSKKFNSTDFFDVEAAIKDASFQELSRWKSSMTRAGWRRLSEVIQGKMRENLTVEAAINPHHKTRSARLLELSEKYPTPYQRRNGRPAIEAALAGQLLSEQNYIAAKAIVDERREREERRVAQ